MGKARQQAVTVPQSYKDWTVKEEKGKQKESQKYRSQPAAAHSSSHNSATLSQKTQSQNTSMRPQSAGYQRQKQSVPIKAQRMKKVVLSEKPEKEESPSTRRHKHCLAAPTVNLQYQRSIGPEEVTPHETFESMAEIKGITLAKHDRFMRMQRDGRIEDDDSLLQDSQQEPDRETKQEILADQKLQRKRDAHYTKQRQIAEKEKKADNMAKLADEMKLQAMQMKAKAASQGRKEKRKEKDRKKSVDKAFKNFKDNRLSRQTEDSKDRANDLQAWIAKEIQKSIMDQQFSISSEDGPDDEAQEIHSKGGKKQSNYFSRDTSKQSDKSKSRSNADVLLDQVIDMTDDQKFALTRDKLPGNNLMPDKEAQKLSRKDRYGTGVMAQGIKGSEFDRIVEIEKKRMEKPKIKSKSTGILSSKQKAEVKVTVKEHMTDLAIRAGSTLKKDRSGEYLEVDGHLSSASASSLDILPVKEKSRDPEATRQTRVKKNDPVKHKKDKVDPHQLPGQTKIHQEAERQKREEQERRTNAAVTIQRRLRGHWGRREVDRRRYILKDRIEAEYGDFERDFKFNEEFNMQRWLKEKKRVRDLNAHGSMSYMEEIDEVIGESSSTGRNIKQSAQSLQMQNFFTNSRSTKASSTDPLSLIQIFANRNGQIPAEGKNVYDLTANRHRQRDRDASPKRRSRGAVTRDKRHDRKDRRISKKHSSARLSSGQIDEEIGEDYSDSFENSNESRSMSKSGSIKEDIITSSTHNLADSVASFSQSREQRKKYEKVTGKKLGVQKTKMDSLKPSRKVKSQVVMSPSSSNIAEDIEDEVPTDKESEIEEDEGLQGSSFGAEDTFKRDDIISEESHIRDDYNKGNLELKQAEQNLQVRKYISFGGKEVAPAADHTDIKKLEQRSDVEQYKTEGDLRRREVLSDVLKEMRDYESAHVSTVVVDRMEKIVVASLAQKDQLLMGQRLVELEREKRHQEEITKIREEQIAQMTQLMLMLAGSGGFSLPRAGGSAGAFSQGVEPDAESLRAAEIQRKEILDNIQKLISKPIVVQNETLQLNIDTSQDRSAAAQRAMAMGKMNTGEEKPLSPPNQRIDINFKGKQKMTYLEEHELAKKKAQSLLKGEYDGSIEEDIMESAFSKSKERGGNSSIRTSMDFIVDEVGDSIRESIKESISGSGIGIPKGHPVKNLSVGAQPRQPTEKFNEFKSRRFMELKSQSSTEMSQFLEQMNEAIDRERELKEQQLRQDLRFKKVDSKTFDRKMREIQRWAIEQRQEVAQKKDQIAKVRDIATAVRREARQSRFNKKTNGYGDEYGGENEDGNSSEFEIRSDESSITREARLQEHMIRKGIIGTQHETKNNRRIEEKMKLAQRLLDEKNAKIKEGLKEKMKSLQGEKADVMIQKAIDLDVNEEIEKLFSQVKEKINNDESQQLDESSASQVGYQQKKVQFQVQPDRKMVGNKQLGSGPPKSKFTSAIPPEEDSIGESIQIDSQYSQSMKQESLTQGLQSDSGPSGSKENSATMPKNRFGHAGQGNSRSIIDTDSQAASDIKSEIESNYTEDFDETSSHQSKSAIGQSKQLLQKKAEAMIEDSGAYTEDFEESLAQQSIGKDQKMMASAQKQKNDEDAINMNTVIEESIDESIPTGGRSPDQSENTQRMSHSGGQGIEVSGDSEIPSEDLEIQHSARSIEWQIQIEDSTKGGQSPHGGKRGRSPSDKEETISEQLREEDSSFYGSEERKMRGSRSPVYEDEDDEEDDLNNRMAPDDESGEGEGTEPTATDKAHSSSGLGELESVPDKIESVSGSLDERLVEALTQELFEGMMQRYKIDNTLDLTIPSKPVDEDEFKNKWPYTMDVVVEEQKVKVKEKPRSDVNGLTSLELANRGAHQPQKDETVTQRADKDFKQKHESMTIAQKEVIQRESDFLDFMIERVKLDTLIDVLSEPITHDPLKMLARIQAYSDEDLSLSNANDLSNPADQQVLPQVFFNKVEREFAIIYRMKENGSLTKSGAENSDDLSPTQQEAESIANTHHYALYETLNEALDMERPYQYKGEPMPWSKNTRLARQRITHEQARRILDKAKAKVLEWGQTAAGTKVAPLPPPPPLSHDDFGSEVTPPPLAEAELERRDLLRQERLGEVLTKDINEQEPLWLDYEIEDTQTRFDLADMILTTLAGEATDILSELMSRRF